MSRVQGSQPPHNELDTAASWRIVRQVIWFSGDSESISPLGKSSQGKLIDAVSRECSPNADMWRLCIDKFGCTCQIEVGNCLQCKRRSAKAFTPIFSYFPLAMQAMGDQYDASANPKGFINMAVAENRMMPQHVIGEAPTTSASCHGGQRLITEFV